MTTSKLFDKITTCSLALRFKRGEKDYQSAFEEVMECLPEPKTTKNDVTNVTTACVEFLGKEFAGSNSIDKKVIFVMCVVVSIADGRAESGIAHAICNRFRGLEDFDPRVMKDIFSFSLVNTRTLLLFDNVMVHKKTHIRKDIRHEFNAEFVFLFFGILESLVRRGKYRDEFGYVTTASLSNMRNARTTLEKHVTWIATKFGACFKLDALKDARPRVNLFPKGNGFPVATIGCKTINFDTATVDTLKHSLFDTTIRDEFVDIIFTIISHSHKDPCDTYVGIKFNTVKEFFLDKILEKAVADRVLEKTSATPRERCLKESFAKATEKFAQEAQVHEEEMQHLRKGLTKQLEVNHDITEKLREKEAMIKRMESLYDEEKERLTEANQEADRVQEQCDDLHKLCQELEKKLVSANKSVKFFEELSRDMNDKLESTKREAKREVTSLRTQLEEAKSKIGQQDGGTKRKVPKYTEGTLEYVMTWGTMM
jgi:hypothetical protein